MANNEISGAVHRKFDVLIGSNSEGEDVVELRFTYMKQHTQVVVVDEATAVALYVKLRQWAMEKGTVTREKGTG